MAAEMEAEGTRRRVAIEAHLDDFASTLELGLPPQDATSVFDLDPEVKLERISVQGSPIAERKGDSATLRDSEGRVVTFPFALWSGESMLSQIADPERFPALPALRDHFLGWRFHHHFPTDADAPARRAMVRVRTPVLAADGHDLASALRTIVEIGDAEMLVTAVDRAFPGCRLHLDGSTIGLETPGLRRPLAAQELSDGMLRYLYLLAALLTPRPPRLLAFNEPETSLHPDLLGPLAELRRRRPPTLSGLAHHPCVAAGRGSRHARRNRAAPPRHPRRRDGRARPGSARPAVAQRLPLPSPRDDLPLGYGSRRRRPGQPPTPAHLHSWLLRGLWHDRAP